MDSLGATRLVPVPFLDLGRSHDVLTEDLVSAFRELIGSSQFVNGPEVAAFEERFALYCGAGDAVAVASGLDALRLVLEALDLERGDEVLVPAMTFVATFEAVSQAGLVPVPVDIGVDDYCMDVAAARHALGPRARVVLPVHLYGQLADCVGLRALTTAQGLVLVEDACQAHGAARDGLRAGRAGDAAAFSFYPGKNLGAMGDGGAVTTASPAVAARVRALREHGQTRKYRHDHIGWTSRLDTIQARVLLEKLPFLDTWNEQRRVAASYYSDVLAEVGDLVLPPVSPSSEHVWHLYVVRTSDPNGMAAFLGERGIACGRHYPDPPHLTGAYAHLGYRAGSFPVAEALASECLSLPLFPGIREAELESVAGAVRSWFDG